MYHEAEPTASAHPERESEFVVLEVAAKRYSEERGASRTAAREALITLAAPIVRRLARRYRERGEAIDDLEQVALLGLLKAVDGYDPERGSFGGYLLSTASGELKRHFRDRGWNIRVPRRLQELTAQVTQATAQLTADRARRPSALELAQELQVSESDVIEALASTSAYRPMSLNAVLPGEDRVELGDTLGNVDSDITRVEDRLTVEELLCLLPARERRILAMRFYSDHTQSEIAEAMGMSQMHASRLLSRALSWLRDALLSDNPGHWNVGRSMSDPTRLSVRMKATPDAVVVELGGELERDTADQLRRALATAVKLGVAPRLRVDLHAVPFVDAAAIAVLIGAGEKARRAGMRLCLVGARPYVGQALATAGLWPFLEEQRPAPRATEVDGRRLTSQQADEAAVSACSTAHTTLPPPTVV